MDRIIKFRAIDLFSDFVYGQAFYIDSENNTGYIANGIDDYCPVKSDTVCQFTGLVDKNGVDIYEGDIINHNGKKFICSWSLIVGFCFVEVNKNLGNFIKDSILMKYHNIRSQFEISNYIKYCEVLGNLYENPELLK